MSGTIPYHYNTSSIEQKDFVETPYMYSSYLYRLAGVPENNLP